MKKLEIYKHINIDNYSLTPKYLQLASSIISGIRENKIKKNDILPSINDLSFELEISRDTAEKSYRYLKNLNILGSVPGKGYYILSVEIGAPLKVFLLFNKLSEHKKIIYDAFAAKLGDQATIDFYIYNNDYSLFKKLLAEKVDEYAYYIIIPHFLEGGEDAYNIINTIPKDKLVLLDKKLLGVDAQYAAVYEDFENDIYGALEQALERLSKYNTLKIIFPEYTYHPVEILNGFKRFCHQYAFNCKVVHNIQEEPINAGEVYINLMEKDLVILIERILATNLKVGRDVGVISYNEIPLKKIILNGITTISSDFHKMGERAAQLILDKSKEHIPIPFYLTLRDSL